MEEYLVSSTTVSKRCSGFVCLAGGRGDGAQAAGRSDAYFQSSAGEGRGEGRRRGEMWIGHGRVGFIRYILCAFIHLHIPLYTFIYLHILSSTCKYLHTPVYTSIYLRICNIKNLRADMKHKNGHSSGPRAFPKMII